MLNTPLVFYQIFVRSFSDASQDGIGDLKGICQKLEYLAYLGIEGIWLSPIFTSPSYHKYDVTNYYEIDPEYGTMADFEELIKRADSLGIKVILDLVVSHTSDKHFWFQEASLSENNPYRNYYIWKSPKIIKNMGLGERMISADTSTKKPWHKADGNTEKYYGLFSKSMPDLNLENLNTRIEILEIARYWLGKGVYGFRIDAAKHLYPSWLPEDMNIAFWQALREELEKDFKNVYLVGEVWAPPEKVAPFFKGLKANFNFELCYDIRDILKDETDSKGLIKKLIQGYAIYSETAPDFIDATFLGNHDQERIASTLKNHNLKLKAAANLLLTLPGNPFIYYGEELGTEGKKPDENLREPYIWNYSHMDYFRTAWMKGRYSNDKRLSPLSIQSHDEYSIFNHYRMMIALRKSHRELSQISPVNIEEAGIDESRLISFIRTGPDQNLLVLQNISNTSISITPTFTINKILLQTQNSSLLGSTIELSPYGLMVASINIK